MQKHYAETQYRFIFASLYLLVHISTFRRTAHAFIYITCTIYGTHITHYPLAALHLWTHTYVHKYLYTRKQFYSNTHINIYICELYLQIQILIRNTCLHTYIYVQTFIQLHIKMHIYTLIQKHIRIQAPTPTYTHKDSYAPVQTFTVYTHAYKSFAYTLFTCF